MRQWSAQTLWQGAARRALPWVMIFAGALVLLKLFWVDLGPWHLVELALGSLLLFYGMGRRILRCAVPNAGKPRGGWCARG